MEEEEGDEEEYDEEDEESEENESDSSWNDSQSIVQSAALNLLYLSASWAFQSEDQSEKLRETPTPINRKNTRRPRNTRNKLKRETRSTRNAKATTIIEKRNNEVNEMEEQVTNCELKKRKYNKNKNKETENSDSSMEGTQCSRVNGRGWRCKRMAVAGFALCPHHQGKGRLQNKRRANNINGVEDASTKRRDATKRKRSRST
ncbi:hypothetical protein QJS04_geneDACA017493 [Acorus gramineus]|uniref:WRC domain-containing protein n=1 Tax=Acorus gramineus TaxID=55184 RepID=A0AAV9AI96_ACOGR|nr:hypothetical protein QJS04_geneDACA017493 [Acorus gramineus]